MRLLVDQNLSYKLVARLLDIFPGAAHVRDLGMADAEDRVIWDFAKSGNWVVVSKDGDFHQLSLLFGAPPKVIWIRAGNASTDSLAALLRSRQPDIDEFLSGPGALLLLGG